MLLDVFFLWWVGSLMDIYQFKQYTQNYTLPIIMQHAYHTATNDPCYKEDKVRALESYH